MISSTRRINPISRHHAGVGLQFLIETVSSYFGSSSQRSEYRFSISRDATIIVQDEWKIGYTGPAPSNHEGGRGGAPEAGTEDKRSASRLRQVAGLHTQISFHTPDILFHLFIVPRQKMSFFRISHTVTSTCLSMQRTGAFLLHPRRRKANRGVRGIGKQRTSTGPSSKWLEKSYMMPPESQQNMGID